MIPLANHSPRLTAKSLQIAISWRRRESNPRDIPAACLLAFATVRVHNPDGDDLGTARPRKRDRRPVLTFGPAAS